MLTAGLLLVTPDAFGADGTSTESKRDVAETLEAKGDTVEVVAEGVGVDVEAARRDACRNAVRQVVGAHITAKTIVEHDQVISDKVISRSDAFVSRIEPLPQSESQEGRLVRLRIKAVVRTKDLLDALRSSNVAGHAQVVAFDALSDQARFETVTELHAAVYEQLADAVGQFPNQYVSLAIDGKPRVTAVADGQVTVETMLRLTPNLEAFRKVSHLFGEAVKASSCPSGYWAVEPREFPEHVGRGAYFLETHNHRLNDTILAMFSAQDRSMFREGIDRVGKSALVDYSHAYDMYGDVLDKCVRAGTQFTKSSGQQGRFVFCFHSEQGNWKQMFWQWALLTDKQYEDWLGSVREQVACCVEFNDAAGKAVWQDAWTLSHIGRGELPGPPFRHACIAPFYVQTATEPGRDPHAVPAVTFVRRVRVPEATWAAVKSASCNLKPPSKE